MKKIFIVEDDFYISKLYQRTFTLAGFEVDTAISGKQALEKSQAGTYDVILLDVMLGDMSGLDVLKLWRAPDHRFKTTPVFLSTNRGEDAIVKQGFALGMEGYFYKSQYVPQDIVNEINAFFSRQDDGSAGGASPSPAVPAQADESQLTEPLVQSSPVSSVPEAPPVPAVSVEYPVSPAVEPIVSSAVPTVIPQEGTMQYAPQEGIMQPSPQESAMQYPPQEGTMQYAPQGGAVQYPPQQFNQTGQPDPFAGSAPPAPMQPQGVAAQYPPQGNLVQYPPPSVSPYPPAQPPAAVNTVPQEGTMQYPPQEGAVQYPPQQQGAIPGNTAQNNGETNVVTPHIDGV